MKRILFLAIVTSTWMAGCTSGPTPIPDPTSASATLYVNKCGACHAVPHPKRNTAAEWEHLLALMEQRMAERGMTALSAEEHATLLGYLQNNAR